MAEDKLSNEQIQYIAEVLRKFASACFDKQLGNPCSPDEFDYWDRKLSVSEKKLVYEAKRTIPSPQNILQEAVERLVRENPKMFDRDYVSQHFSSVVVALEDRAFKVYAQYKKSFPFSH